MSGSSPWTSSSSQGGQGAQANPTTVANANRTVTLEATTYDAERVAVASRLGRLSLVVSSAADDVSAGQLRNPGYRVGSAARSACHRLGCGDVSPALRDHLGGKSTTIRVNRGKDVEEVHF